MKNYIIGSLITIALFTLYSYKSTTNQKHSEFHTRIIIPLKQKKVITTDDITNVNSLVKQGYRVEFVTENLVNKNTTYTTYTLILY